MKARVAVAVVLGAVLISSIVILRTPTSPFKTESQSQELATTPATAAPLSHDRGSFSPNTSTPQPVSPPAHAEELPGTPPNKLERLGEIRESFRALAAGAAQSALQAAKQLTNEVERETALLALVTEWTHGELSPPRERATAIARYGVEAGLGMELAKNPELALLWANELTDNEGRVALVRDVAANLVASDPASAFALADQVPESERRKFFDGVFSYWGGKDTEGALTWINQIPDPAERDADLRAIRSSAPVGIGAALAMRDGYPVINQVLPGTPAEVSGQLHAGDRIVGVAQGDNAFVDAHTLALNDVVQLIRGAPGTTLQLQILPANAAPNSLPQTVYIQRDQLKFKR